MHALCRIADLSQKNYTVVINMFYLFKLFLMLSWYAFQLIFKCVLEMPIVVYLKSLEKFSFISIFLVCVCVEDGEDFLAGSGIVAGGGLEEGKMLVA